VDLPHAPQGGSRIAPDQKLDQLARLTRVRRGARTGLKCVLLRDHLSRLPVIEAAAERSALSGRYQLPATARASPANSIGRTGIVRTLPLGAAAKGDGVGDEHEASF
jgi:hypothetical protein